MAFQPISTTEQGADQPVRVHVLGPLRVTGPHGALDLPRAAHHLIGIVAGAGPSGISREELARELWGGGALPDSWMSAIRNRTTAARKTLGAASLHTASGRYWFGPAVSVDSWDLIEHKLAPTDPDNELHFLDGEPLADIPDSNLTIAHGQRVREARAALIDQTLDTERPLSVRALQSLRIYQRENQLDPAVAVAAVRAHLIAGQQDHATSILASVKEATGDALQPPAWVVELERTVNLTRAEASVAVDPQPTLAARARLFSQAADHCDWSLALEIAMQGLPEAERIEGDPERLALLESIPLDGLEPSLRFSLALALARHLMYAGREAEAHQWSQTTRELAATPSEELLCYITSALVGDAQDQRLPIPLPDAFESAPSETVNLRSLQVAVMSHLERDSFEGATALQRRFTELVETSGEPYRRWHLLLLQSMTKFVNGSLTEAAEAAKAAHDYASFFGIVDAEIALIGQLSNARLIDPSLPGIDDYQGYPTSAPSSLSRALQAVTRAQQTGDDSVDRFLESYDFRNRMFFTFAVVNAVAPYVRSGDIRAEITQQLRERTGTSAIWGTGVLHLGPVDRTLARVIQDKSQTAALLADAIAVADAQHSCIWQVICRLDLAAATNNATWRIEAETLAVTPDLQSLVATYKPWPALVTS